MPDLKAEHHATETTSSTGGQGPCLAWRLVIPRHTLPRAYTRVLYRSGSPQNEGDETPACLATEWNIYRRSADDGSSPAARPFENPPDLVLAPEGDSPYADRPAILLLTCTIWQDTFSVLWLFTSARSGTQKRRVRNKSETAVGKERAR